MKQLIRTLIGEKVQDIIVVGLVVLDDDPAEFLSNLDRVYLEIGKQLVELRLDDRTLHVNITVVDAVQFDFKFELEESHRVCYSSIGKYVLANRLSSNRLTSVSMCVGQGGAIVAIEFTLESGQVLFFDPTHIDGFNFGGIEQKALWLSQGREHQVVVVGPNET